VRLDENGGAAASGIRDAGLLAPIYRGAPMDELTTLGYPSLAGELDAESLPRRRTVRPGWWAGFG